MDDLISRQAAIDAILAFTNTPNGYSDTYDKAMIISTLKDVPSAQPEIIRCKDCKHFAGEGMYCAFDIIVPYDNFYCYHGERKDD